MNWSEHHQTSERFAVEAELAARNGEFEHARKLYRAAAVAEHDAFDSLDPTKVRTLGITAVSAASLYFKSGDSTMAREIASRATSTDTLPEFARQELKILIETIEEQVSVTFNDAYRAATEAIAEAQRLDARELDLSSMGLTELPQSLGELTQLHALNLSSNRLERLPESLAQLTKLRSLNVRGNELSAVPRSFQKLSEMRSLDLADNRLSRLPEWLGHLKQLQSLNASYNELSTLPEPLTELRKLTSLDLSYNELDSLPEWLGELKQLHTVNVSFNKLTALPSSLGGLANSLKALYLHGNLGLRLPPEILGADAKATSSDADAPPPAPSSILEYYFRIVRSGRKPLNEAKLILVGRGGVGKTCLIKRLVHGTFDEHEPETPGIERQPWQIVLTEGDPVRLHVWDFGGQEILHGTHQFFLTERTVYLLVLSGREGLATQDAEYWLQLIRSFGGDSPVVVGLNKSYGHPFDVNRELLREKYKNILEFVETDCRYASDGTIANEGREALGIEKIHQLIIKATMSLEHLKFDFPAQWFQIKERLAGMEERFITWDRYQEICAGLGEAAPQAQRELARFLHILGIALNYRDDPRLHSTNVLNPRWVADGIYTILRTGQKERSERKGVLDIADLARVLDSEEYPENCHEFLLALMENFQLCFRLPGGGKRYLVPELLGEDQPAGIKVLLEEGPALEFRYQYEVLPEGLLPRFIALTHFHADEEKDRRWRTGVVLQREDARAVVRADVSERRVDIRIAGKKERSRRDLLAIIRNRFDEQHRSMKGLKVEELVPLPGEAAHVAVKYKHLLLLEERGEAFYWPEGATRKYRVAELLDGIESHQRREDARAPQGKKHVFLSYCHENLREVRRLHDDLLAAGEKVWWDRDMLGGEDWRLSIQQAMEDAYAVLVCLSAESESRITAGIYPEVQDAIDNFRRYSAGVIYLIPIRLSECKIPRIRIDANRYLDALQCVDLFPLQQRTAQLDKLIEALQRAPHHP